MNKPARTLKGRVFMAFGYVVIALQAYNLYLFLSMIGGRR